MLQKECSKLKIIRNLIKSRPYTDTDRNQLIMFFNQIFLSDTRWMYVWIFYGAV